MWGDGMVQKLACHAKFRVVILIFPLTIGCLVVGAKRNFYQQDIFKNYPMKS
jgi:hypothetical protein